MELKNLKVTIDEEKFDPKFKEKNIKFFNSLDQSVTNKEIKVFRAYADDDHFSLIIILENNKYNPFPEPLLLEYLELEYIVDIEKLGIKLDYNMLMDRYKANKILAAQAEAGDSNYYYMYNKEMKARLVLDIIKETKGKLSKDIIEDTVNSLDEFEDITVKYISDAKEFAKEITLIDHEDSHSCAGEERTKEDILHLEYPDDMESNFKFNPGKDYKYCYSNNGNIEMDDSYIMQPNFNINSRYLVLKDKDYTNSYDNHCNEDSYDKSLIIYIPDDNPYKMDNDIKEILEKFNI